MLNGKGAMPLLVVERWRTKSNVLLICCMGIGRLWLIPVWHLRYNALAIFKNLLLYGGELGLGDSHIMATEVHSIETFFCSTKGIRTAHWVDLERNVSGILLDIFNTYGTTRKYGIAVQLNFSLLRSRFSWFIHSTISSQKTGHPQVDFHCSAPGQSFWSLDQNFVFLRS